MKLPRGFKRLVLTCLLLGTIFAAGSYTVHSSLFHSYLLSVLRRATGWNVSIRDSHLKLLRLRIFLDGVNAENAQKTVSVSAEHVRFDISAFSLIRGKIIVTDFDVDGPNVFVRKTDKPGNPIPADILQRLYSQFERSTLLQNVFIQDATATNLKLTLARTAVDGSLDTSDGFVGKAVIGLNPTLLGNLEASADIETTSGLFPPARKVALKASLARSGLTVDSLLFDSEKVTLTAKAKTNGDLKRGGIDLSGTLDVPSVLIGQLSFEAEADLKDGKADIKKVDAKLGDATFHASGQATFPDPGDLKKLRYDLPFEAKDLPLEAIFEKLKSPILGPAKGLGAVQGRLQGELPALKATAKAQIRDFRHGAMRSRLVEGTLDFHWPELDFEADIKPGEDGRLQGHAKGGVRFDQLIPYKSIKAMLKTVDLTFDDGTLQDIIPSAKVSGKLKGELHLKGLRTSAVGPGHAEVTQAHWFLGPVDRFVTDLDFKLGGLIVFTKTEFNAPNIEPILWPDGLTLDTTTSGIVRYEGRPADGLDLKGSYQIKEDYFHIESLVYRRGGSNLTGALHIAEGGGLDAKLKGELNLESLSSIPVLFHDMRGQTRLDLTASGTTREPLLRGTVDFLKDEIQLRGFPSIEAVEGRVVLDGSVLRPKLSGLLGDGRFNVEGSMGMKTFKPENFDLAFKGSDLSYSKPNAYRVDFDANVTLKGAMPSPKLSGRVDIVDALYTKPFQLRELVLKAFEEESTAEEADWDKTFEPWQLDLSVKHSGDLRIRNNIADIYLLADLQVGGTYGRPIIRGALTATEGQIFLFGDTFTLNEGRLEYIDPAHREPYLRITAEEDLPPLYTVFVELKGYLSNLQVNLTSTPGLPREDVLSLITTGHTQQELREAGLSRQAMGMGVLAGELTSAIGQPISRKTGLDVFRLEASESGQLSKLSVGKYVTDRLTLEFQSDFAPETAQRILQANYYLTDNILIKGTQIWENNQNGTGPRFNFNLSFRFRMF